MSWAIPSCIDRYMKLAMDELLIPIRLFDVKPEYRWHLFQWERECKAVWNDDRTILYCRHSCCSPLMNINEMNAVLSQMQKMVRKRRRKTSALRRVRGSVRLVRPRVRLQPRRRQTVRLKARYTATQDLPRPTPSCASSPPRVLLRSRSRTHSRSPSHPADAHALASNRSVSVCTASSDATLTLGSPCLCDLSPTPLLEASDSEVTLWEGRRPRQSHQKKQKKKKKKKRKSKTSRKHEKNKHQKERKPREKYETYGICASIAYQYTMSQHDELPDCPLTLASVRIAQIITGVGGYLIGYQDCNPQ